MPRLPAPNWIPHPWHVLTEAALAYAAAETEEEVRKAEDRLRYAAKRWGQGPRKRGRPSRPITGTEIEDSIGVGKVT